MKAPGCEGKVRAAAASKELRGPSLPAALPLQCGAPGEAGGTGVRGEPGAADDADDDDELDEGRASVFRKAPKTGDGTGAFAGSAG